MTANDTTEVPNETYDALSEIFETCVEEHLYLVLKEGVYAELAEYKGCDEAWTIIEDWLVQHLINEAHEHGVSIEYGADTVRMETRNFHGSYSIDRGGYGDVSISNGTWYHDEFDDTFELEMDEPPTGDADDEVRREMYERGKRRSHGHPSLTAAERNRGGFR